MNIPALQIKGPALKIFKSIQKELGGVSVEDTLRACLAIVGWFKLSKDAGKKFYTIENGRFVEVDVISLWRNLGDSSPEA